MPKIYEQCRDTLGPLAAFWQHKHTEASDTTIFDVIKSRGSGYSICEHFITDEIQKELETFRNEISTDAQKIVNYCKYDFSFSQCEEKHSKSRCIAESAACHILNHVSNSGMPGPVIIPPAAPAKSPSSS